MIRRWFVLLTAALAATAGFLAPPAPAAGTPIGRLGETLRVDYKGIAADVTVHSVLPSEIPPGFGYPPRPPRHQVWRGQVTIHAVQVPAPYVMAISFQFRGVTPTGDAYEPRNTDAPDALQYAIQNVPTGATVSGGVWWDCYRDLVSNVVLIDKYTGIHLAQWNL
jgi:hypothetical protein